MLVAICDGLLSHANLAENGWSKGSTCPACVFRCSSLLFGVRGEHVFIWMQPAKRGSSLAGTQTDGSG